MADYWAAMMADLKGASLVVSKDYCSDVKKAGPRVDHLADSRAASTDYSTVLW